MLVFGFNFLLQLGILLYQSYTSPVIRDGRFRIVERDGAPCSFGNTIFINPAGYDWETYNQILIHEKTHVSGRHTVDILLAEVAVVCQWFNPVVWLYRREVENNLEFLTDAAVLRHGEVERLAYQLSLLRVSAPHLPFSITNNYNQSLLKRRIVMMNSSSSSTWTVWKYFFLLPIFTTLVLVLNKPAAYSQEPSKNERLVAPVPPVPAVVSIPAVAVAPVAVVAPVRRIAAKATVASPVAPAPVVVPAVAPVAVPAEAAQPSDTLTEGAWFVTTSDNKLSFELKADDNDENHFWSSTLRVGKDEINPFPGAGNVSFKLVRDAGTMLFTGQFDGQQGFGHFHFQADEGYFRALQQMGVEDMEGRRQLSFFMANVKKEFAGMVVHSGYPHISGRMLISFSALHIDRDFIQYWRSSGVQDADEPRTLITLKAQNIDKAYVEEMKAAGYDHLSARELNTLKAQHITGSYIRSIGGGRDNQLIPVRELVSYKAMNIDSGYINSLRKLGYTNLERKDIVMLYNMHVTADYIRSLRDMGYRGSGPAGDRANEGAGDQSGIFEGFQGRGTNQSFSARTRADEGHGRRSGVYKGVPESGVSGYFSLASEHAEGDGCHSGICE
ncbi:M56 family metallopeptidase [Puia sp. P3]|uniref:M56 family metallopeptidase n=1 Tax=Puia sp. P3 TaxID=3423952 RepID=UPI003D67700C